jgi:hypothetical protein
MSAAGALFSARPRPSRAIEVLSAQRLGLQSSPRLPVPGHLIMSAVRSLSLSRRNQESCGQLPGTLGWRLPSGEQEAP